MRKRADRETDRQTERGRERERGREILKELEYVYTYKGLLSLKKT